MVLFSVSCLGSLVGRLSSLACAVVAVAASLLNKGTLPRLSAFTSSCGDSSSFLLCLSLVGMILAAVGSGKLGDGVADIFDSLNRAIDNVTNVIQNDINRPLEALDPGSGSASSGLTTASDNIKKTLNDMKDTVTGVDVSVRFPALSLSLSLSLRIRLRPRATRYTIALIDISSSY
eukprot:TRINITY_DN677_c0_g1_i5.p3 TRINITY_DN677_c0_g1~~TRINITY_DN677_c0_g1_i5.p3  ORF type:complete len:176 (-),score=25.64 TRINITY_DN677_c0_g1_i5:201-728(-)